MLAGYRQEWDRLPPGSAESNGATPPPSNPARIFDHAESRLSPLPSVLGILGHATRTPHKRVPADFAAGEDRPRPAWRIEVRFGRQVLVPLNPTKAVAEPLPVRLDRAPLERRSCDRGLRRTANSLSTPPVSTISSSRKSGWTSDSKATG
jgi:hypothetical protein